ncbi:hypothetical protein H2204_000404 [Knufia peltigerae]|uniref:Uncharacterized protein n=1 Tax=Knufia peltigerae TaxID=1002370 RepID=A0AA39D480_9EURO|nr:hypothetical protein H2204_000404 [Knufia peltigerae]
MSTLLNGTAFITGSGSGIGQACAVEFARSGCTGMLITDINEVALKHTVNLISETNSNIEVLTEVADITADDVAERLVQRIVSRFGRLDYALNVAGISLQVAVKDEADGQSPGIIGKQAPIHKLDLSTYKQVMDVNAESVWLCERAEVAQMMKQSLGPTQIIETPIINPGAAKFALAYVEQFTAMKRLGTAQEVADVVAFLCSSRASYVSGAGFLVDGGHTAHYSYRSLICHRDEVNEHTIKMTNGILWAGSSIREGSSLPDSTFNEWYSKIHIPDILDTGKVDFAIRFKALDASRQHKYMTVYDVPDINSLQSDEIMGLSVVHPIPGDYDVASALEIDLRAYEIVQTVESANAIGRQSRGLVTTCVDVPAELDQEFNDWFNQQHLGNA